MFTLYKMTRKFIKAIAADNDPWQIGLGVAYGCLLGFLPLMSLRYEFFIAWPALLVLCMALLINVHLGSVFLFFGIASMLHLACYPLAERLGGSLDGIAQRAADIPLLHSAGLSHTGWLGMPLLGIVFSLIAGIGMWRFTVWFRRAILPSLLEKRRLMKIGKVANKAWLVRGACWFFAS